MVMFCHPDMHYSCIRVRPVYILLDYDPDDPKKIQPTGKSNPILKRTLPITVTLLMPPLGGIQVLEDAHRPETMKKKKELDS